MPLPVVEKLTALKRVPWIPHVQRKCLLKILTWPAQIPSRNRWELPSGPDPKPYIPTHVGTLLSYAEEVDPTPYWKDSYELLESFQLDLIAISSEFGGIEPDGPIGPGLFRYRGQVLEGPKQRITQHYVQVLWKAKPGKMSFAELAKLVWGDREEKLNADRVGKQRTLLHRFFRENAIDWHVEVFSATQEAALLPGPPKK